MQQLIEQLNAIHRVQVNQTSAEQVIEAVKDYDRRHPCQSCSNEPENHQCLNVLRCHKYDKYTPISTKDSNV